MGGRIITRRPAQRLPGSFDIDKGAVARAWIPGQEWIAPGKFHDFVRRQGLIIEAGIIHQAGVEITWGGVIPFLSDGPSGYRRQIEAG